MELHTVDVAEVPRDGVARATAAGARADALPTDHTRSTYERVRRAILDGSLQPGVPISQVRLAAELQVSRTPLREALRLLENEGLVESDYNRRVRAKPLTMPDLEALTAMRLTAEPLGVRLTAPTLSAERLRAIRSIMEELHGGVATGADAKALALLHRRFHFAFFEGAEGRLRGHLENLWDQGERYRHIYVQVAGEHQALLHSTMREHELILQAADARDGRVCSWRVAEHIARTALAVIHQVDVAYDPSAIREALALVTENASSAV
jgi:DNA-binding GntR family transcriptional regulator